MRRSHANRSLARALRMAWTAEVQEMSASEGIDRFEGSRELGAGRSLDRRDFIRSSAWGLATAAYAVSGCKIRDTGSSVASAPEDIVIIGAGVAGLTCAYRLYQVGVGSTVYEATNRVGGRMFSLRNFNADGQFCELGAELVDSTNLELIELATELDLQAEGYEQGDPLQGEPELFYYGGKIYTDKELFEGLRPLLASVAGDLKKLFPDGTVFWPTHATANTDVIVKYDHMSLDEYFQSKKSTTVPWILQALRSAYETEYGGALDRQSALNFLCLADTNLTDGFTWYGASDEWGRIRGGNQGVVDRLYDHLKGKIPLELGHELVAIRHSGSTFKLTFQQGGTTKEVSTKRVVCALPFSTLRHVDGLASLGLSPLKLRSIKEFAYGTNAKFMTSYADRPWRKKGKLPESQAMVMTDLKSGMLWETSRIQPGKSGIITNFLGGVQGAQVTEAHLKTILADVDVLWPGLGKLHDGKAMLKAWAREKFAMGSYSSPAPGQYTSFIGVEGAPELDGGLLFIGEHTSADWIGFMNGGVQTGNVAAYQIAGKTMSKVTEKSLQTKLGIMGPKRTRVWRKLALK